MCNNVVDQVGLMVTCIFHCEFACFLELAVGCAEMSLKIYPILLKWIHPVPDFNCILEFTSPVNNHVGDVGRLDLGARGSIQIPVL